MPPEPAARPRPGLVQGADVAAGAGLVLLAAVYFWDVLLTDRTFYFRDATTLVYPVRRLIAELIRDGQWPLWNPYVQSGTPLAADVSNNVFYPLSLLYIALPFDVGFKAFVLIHSPVASIGQYALGRWWGLGRAPALIGGVAFMLSGPLLSLSSVPSFLAGLAWLPLTWLAFARSLETGDRRWHLLAGGLLALQTLGDPHMAYMTGAVLAIVGFCSMPRVRLARVAARLAVVAALASLLAAVQLVPLVELFRESARAEGIPADEAARWSLPPWRLVELVLPRVFGDPAGGIYWGGALLPGGSPTPWLPGLYVGVPTLVLAGLGLLTLRRRPPARALAMILTGATLLALGAITPLHALARAWVPLFGAFRYPEKWWLLGAFALCGLGAIGLDEALRGPGRSRWWGVGGLLVVALGLLTLGLVRPWQARILDPLLVAIPAAGERAAVAGFVLGQARARLLLAAGLLAVTAGALVLARGPRVSRQGAAGLLVGALALDLLATQRPLVPLAPARLHATPSPLRRYLPDGAQPYRVQHSFRDWLEVRFPRSDPRASDAGFMAWLVASLYPETGIRYRVQSAMHQGPAQIAAYRSLAERFAADHRQPAFLSLWNVEYFVTLAPWAAAGWDEVSLPPDLQPVRLYRNRDPLPRAWIVPAVEAVATRAEAIERVASPTFDPRVVAVLEPSGQRTPSSFGGPDPGRRVEVVRYDAGEVVVDVPDGPPGILVLADQIYPGWQAAVDGQPASLWRANVAMRAVAIGPGPHRVRFRFRPGSLPVGAVLSGLGGVWLLAGWLRARQILSGGDAA